jgi:hypothetical protein
VTLTATSSNPSLISNSYLNFNGGGTNRFFQLFPDCIRAARLPLPWLPPTRSLPVPRILLR